jgi:hypothetical protein
MDEHYLREAIDRTRAAIHGGRPSKRTARKKTRSS